MTSSPSPTSPPTSTPPPTTLLILGAGWTSTFLLPHLTSLSIPHACTSTTGRPGTIHFVFRPSFPSPPPIHPSTSSPPAPPSTSPHPSHTPPSPYHLLPPAHTILITFPLKDRASPSQLITSYRQVHGTANTWILLGSTGIWNGEGLLSESSPYDTTSPRALAEDAFLKLLGVEGTVLCLAGLWGDSRHPRNWITKVAGSKERLWEKGSLHLVHGRDVSKAIVVAMGVLGGEKKKRKGEGGVGGKRWIVTDGTVYDWWEVVMVFGGERERGWVSELMRERGVEEMPRKGEALGRRLDGRGWWGLVGLEPGEGLFGGEGGRIEEEG